MRALAAACLLPLTACHYGYGVSRCADPPYTFEPSRLQEALRAEPGVSVSWPWNGTLLIFEFERGAASAIVAYETGAEGGLACGSSWFNTLPDEVTLTACLALQDDLVRALERTVPGFPPASAFRREWDGFGNPLGAEWAALRARVERDPGP
jgi:hypothetical protein